MTRYTSEHDMPWFSDPDQRWGGGALESAESEPEWHFCACCHDFTVSHEGEFCLFCAMEAMCGCEVAEQWAFKTPQGRVYLRELYARERVV